MNLRQLRIALLIFAAAGSGATPPADPVSESLLSRISSAVEPERALEHVRRIYATDRWFTFPKFEETARYLEARLRELGLAEVELVRPPADGRTQYGYWTMPLAWDVRNGRLEIVEPEIAADTSVLADYQKVPASIGMWCGPTPPGGITADLVEFSEGADLRGKLVLTPSNLKSLLVRKGALGAVNTFTENPELPDGRQWINAWGDNGWAYTKGSTPLLCFSITPRQSVLVRKLLAERGRVRVRATVDSRYHEGSYPWVTGVIGASAADEEVLLLGHTSEQGAQDNATGVAAMIEAVAACNRLIVEGKLARPRRSIRILAMGEMYGSMHYVATYPERIRRTVAAICVDTPAASYRLAGTEYTFHLNPDVAASFTDALILRLAESYFPRLAQPRPYHESAYRAGTDTYLSDPMIGVPTVWPYSGSGIQTHHNSADRPEDADPRSLRDLAVVTAAYLYTIAAAGETEARPLAELALSRGHVQVMRAADSVLGEVFAAGTSAALGALLGKARERIDHAVGCGRRAVASVGRLVPEARRAAVLGSLAPLEESLNRAGAGQLRRIEGAVSERARQLVGSEAAAPPRSDPGEAGRVIIRRKRFGTLPLDEIPPDERRGFPSGAWSEPLISALYLCDGRRPLSEVIRLVEVEHGPVRVDLAGYFRFLAERGYVELVTK